MHLVGATQNVFEVFLSRDVNRCRISLYRRTLIREMELDSYPHGFLDGILVPHSRLSVKGCALLPAPRTPLPSHKGYLSFSIGNLRIQPNGFPSVARPQYKDHVFGVATGKAGAAPRGPRGAAGADVVAAPHGRGRQQLLRHCVPCGHSCLPRLQW